MNQQAPNPDSNVRSIMRTLPSALIVASIVMVGCARVEVRPVQPSERDDPNLKGVRFYEPWPYLQVTKQTTDKGDVYSTAIVYLPRTNREFVFKVIPGWGTVDGSIALADGWRLTSMGAKMDSKMPETITALTGLIGTIGLGAKESASPPLLEPGLYRVEFDANGFASGLVRAF
jgi:nitrogen fixation protein